MLENIGVQEIRGHIILNQPNKAVFQIGFTCICSTCYLGDKEVVVPPAFGKLLLMHLFVVNPFASIGHKLRFGSRSMV